MKFEWQNYTLEDVSRIYSGGTPSTKNKEYWDGDINWLSSGETGNRYIYSTDRHITKAGVENSSTRLAKVNSTVVASAGQGYTRGQASFLKIDTYVNQSVIVFEPKIEIINPLYLFYNLSNRYDELRLLSDGTSTRGGLSGWIVKRMIICLPPLYIQNRIVDILYSLDRKIETNKRINDNLFQQAMTLFIERFIANPPNAEEQPLYYFADYINGTSFKPSEYSEEGLPIVKIAELKNGITDSTQYFNGSKDEKYIIQNKDILFSWSGNPDTSIDIFIWCGGKAILNQHTFNVKSKNNIPWFIYLLLKYFKPQFTQIASNKQTTGLGHVTVADLKRLSFPYNLEMMKSFEESVSP